MNADNLKKEIKKVKVWHVALLCAGVFLAFAIIGSVLIAAGGGWKLGNGFNIHFGDYRNIGPGKSYDVNEHKTLDLAGVESIVIKCVSDDAEIKTGGSQIEADLVGQCRSTGDPVWLDVRKAGSIAYVEVKYPQVVSISSNTRFTIAIPAEYAGDLSIETVSGDIKAEGMPNRLGNVKLHAVSGDVGFSAASSAGLRAETTSGNVKISGILASATVTTVSGEVTLDYADFAGTTVNTVSGDIRASLPQSAQFGVNFETTSGTFRSTHSSLDVSSADHGFKSGTGSKALFKVRTVSGDFEIEGK